MKVVLTEKPSVARELAAFLGARNRHEGYYEGEGYQVTWALGHLVTLKEPDDYDPALKRWSLETLPFVPQRFELKLIDDSGARKQFSIVKRLFQGASELICATDAGREGELIFRYIQRLTGCGGKPFRRLWLSSLTERAIGEAFRNLRPGSDYDRLYAAARCRSEADWIVGLNATRNFTVRYGQRGLLWSVGRVQTPVLAMIVERDDEIRHFKPETFWELRTRYREVDFRFTGDRFSKEEEGQALLEQVQGHRFVVEKIDRRQEKVLPPLLYDLTELQRDMNRRYGMSAAETLKVAQSLYENKLITYPRTDSRYLTSDMKPELPGILEKLKAIKPAEIGRLDLTRLPWSSRIVNDRKVGDHHAIIPTGALPGQLSPAAQKVYQAVLTRLVAVFYPPCLKEVTTVDGVSNRVPFRARGVRVVEPGWTVLEGPKGQQKAGGKKAKHEPARKPDSQPDSQEDQQELPAFTRGESGPHQPLLKQGQTMPPRPYSENTLLGAMETAGKLIDDEALKEAMKEKGLGTPATRAAMIETLLKRGYIVRNKKAVTATDLGRYLMAVVQDPALKSPELTGHWEAKLKQIERGGLDPQQFMAEIVQYTQQLIRGSDRRTVDGERLGDCPRCGQPVIEGKRGFGCSAWRDGCPFVLWKTYQDHPLSVGQIRELLQRHILLEPITLQGEPRILTLTGSGQVSDIPVPQGSQQRPAGGPRGSTPRSGRRTAGQSRAPAANASDSSLGPCPLCRAAVVEQPKSFSCSDWQQGCRFVIWKTIAGKRISKRTAQTLLRQGRTSLLSGFRSKAGNLFQARLKLDQGQVRFEFD